MKKPFLVVAALLLSLSVTGSGLSGWSDRLLIRAAAATGVAAAGVRCLDCETAACSPASAGAESAPDDRPPACASWSDGPPACEVEGEEFYQSIGLQITNYYPSCTMLARLVIGNGGTIPVRVRGIGLDWEGSGYAVALGNWQLELADGYRLSGRGLDSLVQAVRGVVIDPDPGRNRVWLELEFTALQDFEQAACTVSIDYCRWNRRLSD